MANVTYTPEQVKKFFDDFRAGGKSKAAADKIKADGGPGYQTLKAWCDKADGVTKTPPAKKAATAPKANNKLAQLKATYKLQQQVSENPDIPAAVKAAIDKCYTDLMNSL